MTSTAVLMQRFSIKTFFTLEKIFKLFNKYVHGGHIDQQTTIIQAIFCTPDTASQYSRCHMKSNLTHCIRYRLSLTIYWKSLISILGTPWYKIYIFLEKNG